MVYDTQAARFGPLAMGLPSNLSLACKVCELNSICRLFHGRVGGSFPSPSKDDETTDSSFCQEGCPGKVLLSTYLRMMML